jgi:hypothetical protein
VRSLYRPNEADAREADPKQLQVVYSDIETFPKGDFFKDRSHDLFGDGIVNADGDLWRVQRRVGRDFLSAANHKHLCNEVLPQVWKKAEADLLRACKEGSDVDLSVLTEEFALSVMGFTAFGVSLREDLSVVRQALCSATSRSTTPS